MLETQPLERCTSCNEATGKAGPGDGSLYVEECGPFCEECHKRVLEAITPTSSPQTRLRVVYDDDLLAEQLYLESIISAELYPEYFDLPSRCKVAWRGKARDVLEHYKKFFRAEVLVS
jgi:hypothetical protein